MTTNIIYNKNKKKEKGIYKINKSILKKSFF